MTLETDSIERAKVIFRSQQPEELTQSPLPFESHETRGSTARTRYLPQRTADQRSSEESAEEGEVLPKESASSKLSKPRPTDSITGKEVVEQSSKNPLRIRPVLETSPMELHRHRADTHTRVAHGISNTIAHGTGFIDGIMDSLANGTAEIVEDLAFFVSKTIHGAKHGWSRGKFQ